MNWDPNQYLAFADLRLRPALDLLGRVPVAAPGTVVDLGCGAGNVTRVLAERWPGAQITGIDGSPEMLAFLAESMRERLDATWCIAESGLAGPTPGRSGAPPGKTTVSVAGPVVRTEVIQTGISDRGENMIEFTTRGLRLLSDAISEAGA